jgi:hypothetical protein
MQSLGTLDLQDRGNSSPEAESFSANINAEILLPEPGDFQADWGVSVAAYLVSEISREPFMTGQPIEAIIARISGGHTTILYSDEGIPDGERRIRVLSTCSMIPLMDGPNYTWMVQSAEAISATLPKPLAEMGIIGVEQSESLRPVYGLPNLRKYVGRIFQIATGRTEPRVRGQHAWTTLAQRHVEVMNAKFADDPIGVFLYGVSHMDNLAIVGPLKRAGLVHIIEPEEQRERYPFATAFLMLCTFENGFGWNNGDGKAPASISADVPSVEENFFKQRRISVNDRGFLDSLEIALRADFKSLENLIATLYDLRVSSSYRYNVPRGYMDIKRYLFQMAPTSAA